MSARRQRKRGRRRRGGSAVWSSAEIETLGGPTLTIEVRPASWGESVFLHFDHGDGRRSTYALNRTGTAEAIEGLRRARNALANADEMGFDALGALGKAGLRPEPVQEGTT